jgi:hypothetical protein
VAGATEEEGEGDAAAVAPPSAAVLVLGASYLRHVCFSFVVVF